MWPGNRPRTQSNLGRCLERGPHDAYVRDLAVHPAYQRRGIGSELLRLVLRRTRQDGIYASNVLFEPRLAEFYRRAGFRVCAGGVVTQESRHDRD